ncbi:glycosyltransferase [Cupriavidus malaysiensis]|uniref:Glycosyltransferase family 2 protein n=1 Tax=Cupriavidus malaysiensis TaxID=367825 RepID=A0ABM6FF32_9BURK|nr:hypothetical protein [Cupriavidus malaysiensis]AOZ10516.1 hypothetical protein BKK80_33690 [Cupriavidus malaysiensis]
MPNPPLHHTRDSLYGTAGHPGCTTAPDISVVVIGHDDGARLRRCLDSVHGADWRGLAYELIYVEAGPVGGSPAQGIRPGSAAGRNAGWRSAHATAVLFLDGDTLLAPAFPRLALAALRRGRYAAVWGDGHEAASGRAADRGANALFRLDALIEAGGFDDSLDTGAGPELCRQLRATGWRILLLDAPATPHEVAVPRTVPPVSQARCGTTRAGRAQAKVPAHCRQRDNAQQLRDIHRNLLHGAAIAALPLVLAAALAAGPAASAAVAGAALLAMLRAAMHRCLVDGNERSAALHLVHSPLRKLPIPWHRLRSGWPARHGGAPALTDYTLRAYDASLHAHPGITFAARRRAGQGEPR